MSKFLLSLNKARRRYYERMLDVCANGALTTDNSVIRDIWIKRFNKYFNKFMRIDDVLSFQTNKIES